ncbi:MAG TPA: hypothetical protein VN903_35160 [Polyangia bacterium]|jgi:hypothetical protein|nr:hypothetical protein [Polyangia bacterium]
MSTTRKLLLVVAVLNLALVVAWFAVPAKKRPASERTASTPPEATPAAAPEPPAPATATAPGAAAPNLPPDAAPPSASVAAGVARMSESVLMAHLREVARKDSAQAIEIARAGNKKFPDGPDAPERYSILIHALVTQNQLSEGRGEAEYMVNHFPDSSWVREIEGFTGAHRHRNIRVNDAGQLEYF